MSEPKGSECPLTRILRSAPSSDQPIASNPWLEVGPSPPAEPEPENRQDEETFPQDCVREVERGRIINADVKQVDKPHQIERNQDGNSQGKPDAFAS